MGHAQPIPILQWLARSDSFVVVTYARHPLSLRKIEYLLAERGVDISHETIRF
jgi:transposase-like protein